MVGGDGSQVNVPINLLASNQLTQNPGPSSSLLSHFNLNPMTVDQNLLRLLQSQPVNALSTNSQFIPQPGLPLQWNTNPAFMNLMLNPFNSTSLAQSIIPQSIIAEPTVWEQPSTSLSADTSPSDEIVVVDDPSTDVLSNIEETEDPRNEGHMHSPGLPIQPYFPSHFLRGTHIQVDRDNTRLVEEMKKEDFYGVKSIASAVHDLNMQTGVVKVMESITDPLQVMITFEIEETKDGGDAEVSICDLKVPIEYPLFELKKGWCSYNPSKTINLYGIDAKQLETNDKCIVLTSFEDGSSSYQTA
ncbi:unnamed protein product [Bursaphelenchus xylophilus]|uniref:(pine wood nematode) hypothetical protein n=1 Tax=Bursaphelenchus xylophilus TaxID=6326 RepID=A0A1I7RS96_BURXY|nr:unnamed protein product [Bursaphelenchus xylophilus]CAG9123104.1 unnamed protein product [Bursaphelenchus xylophilus]